MRFFGIPVVSAAILALVLGAVVSAAPDAGAKARGDYNFYSRSAHGGFSSARAHVDTYQRYLSDTHGIAMPTGNDAAAVAPAADREAQIAASGAVDAGIAREASDAIADDIERIQRHVNKMRAHAKTLGDADALAILADVDKNLGVARRGHAALHEEHASESIAPATAMQLAQKVNDSLRVANAEHDRLMQRLHEGDDSAKK
ncbi:MAG: hypothetical protein K8S94_03080 [Planctomycetia bacterium]|nr:hypothetical protein [Planctomycetia bacterium]